MRPITKHWIGHAIDTGLVILVLGVLTGIGWYQDFRNAHFPPPPSRT